MFNRYKKIGVILKSGREIIILCESFEWKYSGNELTAYTIKGIKGATPNYIRIEEIAAVVTY